MNTFLQILFNLPRIYTFLKELISGWEKYKREKQQQQLEKAADAIKEAKNEKEQRDAHRDLADRSF